MPECDYEGCNKQALRDSEHCIFHKPDKNEEEAREFYHRIRQEARKPEGEIVEGGFRGEHREWVFEKAVDWKGYKFPDTPQKREEDQLLFTFMYINFGGKVRLSDSKFESEIDFRYATFERNANFRYATFEKRANFGRSTFKKEAGFGKTKFCESVDFRNTEFGGELDFSKVNFDGPAIFRKTDFYGDTFFKGSEFCGKTDFFEADFDKWTSFKGAEFYTASHDFRNSTFGQLEFLEVSFAGKVDFEKATFTGIMVFEDTEFEELVSFKNIEVEELAGFDRAQFTEEVNFYGAEFSEGANFKSAEFSDEVYFEDAGFRGQANFRGAKFENTTFMGANFDRYSNFDDVEFGGNTVARDVTFCGEASFERAKFGDIVFSGSIFRLDVSFRYSRFSGEADFSEIRISHFGSADFRDTTFHWNTSFKDSVFQTNIGQQYKSCPNFKQRKEQSKKGKKTDFSRATFIKVPDFNGTYFDRKLKFNNTSFQQGISLITDIEDFKELRSVEIKRKLQNRFQKLESQEEACRAQRITHEKEGEKEKADQMFVQEMRARREKRLKRRKEDHGGSCAELFGKEISIWEILKTKSTDFDFIRFLLEKAVVDWTCKYGTSWRRVLIRSAEIMGAFGVLYWLANIVSKTNPVSQPWVGTITDPNKGQIISLELFGIIRGLGNSLYYSAITFTTLGYGDLHPTGLLMKTLSGIESAIGALFAALIIVVFARKWMRS